MEGLRAGERCNFICIYKDYSSSRNEEDKTRRPQLTYYWSDPEKTCWEPEPSHSEWKWGGRDRCERYLADRITRRHVQCVPNQRNSRLGIPSFGPGGVMDRGKTWGSVYLPLPYKISRHVRHCCKWCQRWVPKCTRVLTVRGSGDSQTPGGRGQKISTYLKLK